MGITSDIVDTRDFKARLSITVLSLILVISIGYQLGLTSFLQDEEYFDVFDIIAIVVPTIIAGASFVIAYRYWGSQMLGKSYLALGIGFSMWAAGEASYSYISLVLQIDPYPSIADVFFFALYPFALAHLILNTRHFKKNFDILTMVWFVIVPVSVIFAYSFYAFVWLDGYTPFDYFYGLIFVAASSLVLSFAILGASVFKRSILRTVWLLLAIGLVLQSFTDIWYYYIEIFGGYSETHITNTLWITAMMLIFYALYKHQKVL